MANSIPDDIEKKMFALGAKGREALSKNDEEAAEKAFLACWDLLPDPKEQWDMAPSIAESIAVFYINFKKFREADEWVAKTARMYGDSAAASANSNFLKASLEYERGNLDDAFSLFDGLYKAYKERPFQSQKPEYLKFYKSRAAKAAGR